MIHNDVARRTVRDLPTRRLASRRSPARSLAVEQPDLSGGPGPRALVRDLGPRPLHRLAEGGRL